MRAHTQVSLPALRDLLYSFGQMFLGGDFMTMHSHIHVVTDNMVAGTSAKWILAYKGFAQRRKPMAA